MDVHAGKTGRQGCTFGLLAGSGRDFCCRCQLLEFKLDGGNVRLNGFFDQTDGYQYLRALLVALPKAQTADFYEALLPCCLGLLGCRLTDQSPVFCIS